MGRVIPLSDVTDADVAAWSDLAGRAAEPNPFLEPEYLVPLASGAPDAAGLSLAIVERDGRWMAVMAFSLERGRVLRMPLHHVSIAGPFMASQLGRQHPLLDRDNPGRELAALLECLDAAGLPGTIDMGFVPCGGPVDAGIAAIVADSGAVAQVRRRDDWGQLARGPRAESPIDAPPELWIPRHLNRRHRASLRAKMRHIEQQAGAPLTYADLSFDADALHEFVRLEASGWKGNAAGGGKALAHDSGSVGAFVEVSDRLRADGRWRLDVMRAGDELVYAAIRVRARAGGWFGVIDAYNERFARFSPGQIGRLAELSAHRAAAPDETFDPCMDSTYADATRLYPDRRAHAYVVLAFGGAFDRLRLASTPAVQRLTSGARSMARAVRETASSVRLVFAFVLEPLMPDVAMFAVL